MLYGGLVGYSVGVSIKDCVNYAAINVKQSIASTCTVSSLCFPSGIVGRITSYVGTSETVYANLDGCINRGAIHINDTTQPEDAGKVSYWMGGVVSFVTKENVVGAYMANCKNDAPITYTNINNFAGQYAQIGGIVGVVEYLESNLYEMTNIENTANGDITITGKGNCVITGKGNCVITCGLVCFIQSFLKRHGHAIKRSHVCAFGCRNTDCHGGK